SGGARIAPSSRFPHLPASTAARAVRRNWQVASSAAVIPAPHSLALSGEAPFVLRADTKISVPPGHEQALRVARDLAAWIGTSAGPVPPLVETTGNTEQGRICLVDRDSLSGESYELDIA